MLREYHDFGLGCLGVSVWLVPSQVQVNESDRMVEICAEKSLETVGSLTLNIESRNGSAFGNKIYNAAAHAHTSLQLVPTLPFQLDLTTL